MSNIGDYTIVEKRGCVTIYDIYIKKKRIGEVQLSQDGILYWVRTLDDDLITLLLLKYEVSKSFRIYRIKLP